MSKGNRVALGPPRAQVVGDGGAARASSPPAGWSRGSHEGSRPRPGHQPALAQQHVVDGHHRVARQAQLVGQGATGRKLDAGRQPPRHDRLAQLLVQPATHVPRPDGRQLKFEFENGVHRRCCARARRPAQDRAASPVAPQGSAATGSRPTPHPGHAAREQGDPDDESWIERARSRDPGPDPGDDLAGPGLAGQRQGQAPADLSGLHAFDLRAGKRHVRHRRLKERLAGDTRWKRSSASRCGGPP